MAAFWGLFAANAGVALGIGPLKLGLSWGHDEAAYRLLQASPSQLDRAEAKAREALALSPYENSARLRLVYIDEARDRRLSPEGVALFAASYDLAPFDPSVAAWRTRFALEHWSALTPATRLAVEREVFAFARVHSRDPDVVGAMGSIQDPAGRLAVSMWKRRLRTIRP